MTEERSAASAASARYARALAALCVLWSAAARAQVIEPNGLQVPVTPPGSSEKTLQSYFDAQNEPIDAVRSASVDPATFSPRCGFQAELVLSESQAAAGLAWYNVPSDPHAAPDKVFQILQETKMPGGTLSSDQIRSDPNYAGGLIGFALTKFGGQPIYYSEYERNKTCTSCSMPGPWKLMLAYPSAHDATTYYLAWEDWEGANESGWPDDGDFNDKVFRLSGVRCAGGGEPCDTGKPGVCAQGLTGCSAGSAPSECAPLEAASPEVCDGLDNDCDGVVDDGQPCGAGEVCVQGTCTQACAGSEFPCASGLTCDNGECVDSACIGVHCDAGQVCQQGLCRAPCDGVICPLGQECRSGVCKDPCADVSCMTGSVCREGACLESCTCSGCPDGQACDTASGRCVDSGCEGKSCPAGEACKQGACVDACQGAVCPRRAACVAGQCDSSQQVMRPSSSGGAPTTPLMPGMSSFDAGDNAKRTSADAGAGAATVNARAAHSGCACQLAERRPSHPALGLGCIALLLLWWRTRCSSRASRARQGR